MAIAFDNATNGGAVNPATSLTYSHTVAGTNRILFVGVKTPDTALTGITYAGVSMSFIAKQQNGTDMFSYLYYLIAPSTGANNVVVTASSSVFIGSHASSYTGAKQSGQPDASTTNTVNTNGTYSISVTTIADNSWVVAYTSESIGRLMTADGSSSVRAEVNDGHGKHFIDSNSSVTPAGSRSVGGTVSGASPNWAGVVASIAPLSSTTNASFLLKMI